MSPFTFVVLPLAAALTLVAGALGGGPPSHDSGDAVLRQPARAGGRAGQAGRAEPAPGAMRLRVQGRAFRAADGQRFAWQGITSFRLLEMVANQREADAVALLDWARSQRLTVVRVLAMADVLFKLSPEQGRRALPRLLTLARSRGLHVEIVALADTGLIPVDLQEQVRSVGAVCARHDNCVLEIANEPWHHSQRKGLGEAALLGSLRALVPAQVPVSLGSPTEDAQAAYAAGDYLTVHLARSGSHAGWGHVLRMQPAEALSARTGKPVVDDEPIGAAEQAQPGRRDDDPTRWLAKGVLARLLELGATFHYERGLHSAVPKGREAACFEHWRRGLDALPPAWEERAAVRTPGGAGSAVASFDRTAVLDLYVAQDERQAWAVAVGVSGKPTVRWRDGWRSAETRDLGGVMVVRGERVVAQ